MSEAPARFMVRAWSPDGRRIAGERRAPDSSPAGIVVWSLDSLIYDKLTDFGWYPQWLRDGSRLLFQHEGKIYLVNSRSKKAHEVLSVTPHEVMPYRFALSPDNRWIYLGITFIEADIWLMDLR